MAGINTIESAIFGQTDRLDMVAKPIARRTSPMSFEEIRDVLIMKMSRSMWERPLWWDQKPARLRHAV
jgi:hypothetical protein